MIQKVVLAVGLGALGWMVFGGGSLELRFLKALAYPLPNAATARALEAGEKLQHAADREVWTTFRAALSQAAAAQIRSTPRERVELWIGSFATLGQIRPDFLERFQFWSALLKSSGLAEELGISPAAAAAA